jgi:carbon storage regulator
MLVLARRNQESIRVGETQIKILEIHESYVKLGVEAAPDVIVHREEVYQEIKGGSSDG